MREAFRTVARLQSALSTRANLLLEILALQHQLGVLVRRIDAFARLTVYSRCACDGCGLGGVRLSCWSNRPRSPAGIVKGSVDAGGVGRGDGRDDRASIHNFKASFGRMATENCLWGAPRIHGELLKLGITV
jgi:hypothetical protein